MTIKQIVDKSVELKEAVDLLQDMQADRQRAQERLDAIDLTNQQAAVEALKVELRALL